MFYVNDCTFNHSVIIYIMIIRSYRYYDNDLKFLYDFKVNKFEK